jgi:alginate O-acetyltransferase complex protein AlgJ
MHSSPISGRGPIVLLTVLLAGCGLSALLRPAGPGLAEMRSQSKLPAWLESWREFRAWPRRVDAYINDAFPGRHQLIAAGNGALWKLGWLDSDRVLMGAEGWLFLRRENETFEKTRGMVRPSPAEVNSWGERWVEVERWFADQGSQLWLAVIPDKQTVYPQRVPDWARPAETGLTTTTDLILQELSRRGVQRVVDLRAPLREAAGRTEVYYPTDSHWNGAGAKVAAERILPRLWGQADPEVERLLRTLSVQETGGLFRGDLARMLGVDAFPKERELALTLEGARATVVPGETSSWVRADPGVSDAAGVRAGTLLILGDSFRGTLIPALVEFHARTVMDVHHRLNIPAALVQRERPTVTLLLIVERLLPTEGPRIR